MRRYDLDQPANVLWHKRIPLTGGIEGGETQHFSRLVDALHFVMEQIPVNMRGTAWITTDGPSIQFPEIEEIYDSLPKTN